MSNIEVIDLFCGAGGLSYGLQRSGMKVVAGYDIDDACRYPFEKNTTGIFHLKDVAQLACDEISENYSKGAIRVLAGCAPCQPFSTYAQSRKTKDERWVLLRSFMQLVVDIKPEIVTMENVPQLASRAVWREFSEKLSSCGYSASLSVVSCEDIGLPQTRKRLVYIASRTGKNVSLDLNRLTKNRTVYDAIGQLPAIGAGKRCERDPLHMASSLSCLNLKRIRKSQPGGTWRDWPPSLRSACHRRSTGETYPSVYGRMEWDKPAPTITTQFFGYGNGRFGHPEQDRAISIREASLLQSFPARYKFVEHAEEASFRRLGILIGNAVPPKLGKLIGQRIVETL